VPSEKTSTLEDFWAGLSIRGKVITVGVVLLLLGILAGVYNPLWAAVLILLGIILLLVGVSVMKPKTPAVVQQPSFAMQAPPQAYAPPSGYYPPPAGYAPQSNPTVTTHREVIREIVKVPCKNCGTRVEWTAARCPNCSAPVR